MHMCLSVCRQAAGVAATALIQAVRVRVRVRVSLRVRVRVRVIVADSNSD